MSIIKKSSSFIAFSVGSGGSAAILLFTVPFLTRTLSPSEYAVGAMFVTVTTLMLYVCSVGMDQVFVRFFYELSSHFKKSQLLLGCAFITLLATFLVMLIISPLKHIFVRSFFQEQNVYLFYAVVLGIFVFCFNRFSLLYLLLNKYAYWYSTLQIIQSAIYFVSIIVMHYMWDVDNFWLMIISQLVAQSLVFLISFIPLRKFLIVKALGFSKVLSVEKLKSYIDYGWPFIFSFSFAWAMQSVDRLMLLHLAGSYYLGIYAAAFSLTAPLVLMQGVFANIWTSTLNQKISENMEGSRVFFQDVYKWVSFLMMQCILILVLTRHVIILFLGSKFHDSIEIFLMLLFLPFLYVLTEIVQTGLIYAKKSKTLILPTFLSMTVNVLLSFMFIPSMGAMGAAIAIASAYFLNFIIRYFIAKRYFHIKTVDIRFMFCFFLCLSMVYFASTHAGYLVPRVLISCFVITALYYNDIKFLISNFRAA